MAPGEELAGRFAEKFHDVICGPGGPYEQFEDGLLGQADLPVAVTSAVLAGGFSAGTLMVPVAVYVGLLVVRAGLKTYCEVPADESQNVV